MSINTPARVPAPSPIPWARRNGTIYPIASYRPLSNVTCMPVAGITFPLAMLATRSLLFAAAAAVCVVAVAIAGHYLLWAARRRVDAAITGIYSLDTTVDGSEVVVFHDIAVTTVSMVWAVDLDTDYPHDGPRAGVDWSPLGTELLAAATARSIAIDVKTHDGAAAHRRRDQHTVATATDGGIGGVADWVHDVLGHAHRSRLAICGPPTTSRAYMVTTWTDTTQTELEYAADQITTTARVLGVSVRPLAFSEAYRPPIVWRCF